MKQFFRYLSLIACVLVIGVWILSIWRLDLIQYNNGSLWGAYSLMGRLHLNSSPYESMFPQGFRYFSRANPFSNFFPESLGFGIPYIERPSQGIVEIIIPFWCLFTPLFLLTLKLWYHPIKNWWRGTNRQGFEVELSNQEKNERHDARITKEEKE